MLDLYKTTIYICHTFKIITMKKVFLKFSLRDNQQVSHTQGTLDAIGMMNSGEQMAQVEAIISAINSNPAMLNDPETKALYDDYMKGGNQQSTQQSTQQQTQQVEPAVLPAKSNIYGGQTQQTQQVQQQTQSTPPVQLTEEQFVNNSLFFEKKEGEEISFETVTPENLADSINKAFGLDTTKPEWAKSFLKDFHNNTLKVSTLEKTKEKFDKLQEELSIIPTPLMMAMTASIQGKNWREELKNIDIDYSVDFDKLPFEEQARITQRLLPDLVLNIDDKESPTFKAQISLGKVAFNNHIKTIEQEREANIERAQRKQTTFKLSIDESIKQLSEKYEEFKSEDNLGEIKKIFSEKKILGLFYDENGNIKKDAAETLAFALYGKNIIKRVKGVEATKIANQKVAELLSSQQSHGVGSLNGNNNNITEPSNEIIDSAERVIMQYKQTY